MNLRVKNKSRLLLWGFALGLAALSSGGFLAAAGFTYRLGFPLDDAWIHQTYARSLGQNGEWAFVPGQASAGSTAPLWSGFLSVGHALGLDPRVWTYLLGWLLLAALGVSGAVALRSLAPHKPAWAPWAVGLLAVEWHMVWAAGSGMETLLFSVLVLIILGLLPRLALRLAPHTAAQWFGVGLLTGLSVWVRPDGLTLIGPVLFTLAVRIAAPASPASPAKDQLRVGLLSLLLFSLGLAVVFLPYLMFNQYTAGSWWPNTFFAKQVEYASHRSLPFLSRYGAQLSMPLIGIGSLLAPGFIVFVVHLVRQKNWAGLAGMIWFLGYLFIYAWRLPVTYQHGRYIMPAMPVLFIWGFAGLAEWAHLSSRKPFRRILSQVWVTSLPAVALVFWWLGANAYARDVQVIESEMVAAAAWVRDHTPPDAVIAAHDIGALGYFSQRELIDLAGLISPEVIPFMRDENRLAAFITERQADYLVTFPGWYPLLSAQGTQVFSTDAPYAPELGGENMTIYRWR